MFYPQIKRHISPSALQAWHTSRSNFIRSYFMGKKSPETKAMKAGTMVHKLIELGILPAIKRFDRNEEDVEIAFLDGVFIFGKPDSYSSAQKLENGHCVVEFVDYKTGKENTWTAEKLATDLKMKTTAWLIFKKLQSEGYSPDIIEGHIEYIATEWDEETKEIRPIDGVENVLITWNWSSNELEEFTDFIGKTISEVNEEYPKFLSSTDEFINYDDVVLLAELEAEKKEIEARVGEIKERLMGQLDLGGKKTHETVLGTVYITERKSYKYPDDLEGKTDDGTIVTLSFADKVSTAIEVAKDTYKLSNEPTEVSRSVSFRAKKK